MAYERLTKLRKECGLTQQQAADMLHCRREVYRRYETGGRELPVWALVALARAYGVSTDYILELSDERPAHISASQTADA